MRRLAWLLPLCFASLLAGCGDDTTSTMPPASGHDLGAGTGGGGAPDAGVPDAGVPDAAAPSGGDMTTPPPPVGCTYDETSDGTARLLAIYTLPPTSLKVMIPTLTDDALAAALANGAASVDAPSLGSGLDYAGGCPGTFYGVGDRGINGKVKADKNGVSFLLDGYTPMIARFSAHADGSLAVDQSIDLTDGNGVAVTGLSNTVEDETPYATPKSTTPLAYDQDGLDPEDVRRLPDGDFLICDEYGASVALIDPSGKVKARYTPSTKTLPLATYPVKPILPAIFASRRANKGFEGLAVTRDGHSAYAFLQAPMGDTKDARYANSLVNRIVRIDHVDDPAQAVVSGEWLAVHAPLSQFPAETAQSSVYFNSATWIAANRLLVIERASGRLTLVVLDLSAATNILGQPYEPTLQPESLDPTLGIAGLGITPAARTVVFDSDDTPTFITSPPGGASVPSKLEGLAVINRTTVAIANDNDFGIDDANNRSRLWIVRLKQPLTP